MKFYPQFHHHDGDTHVTVKQQPNDAADAARLHGEIEQKAIELVEKNKISHNLKSIDAEFISYDLEPMMMGQRLAFRVNGRLVRVTVQEHEKFPEAFVNALARELLSDALRVLPPSTYKNWGR